MTLELALFSTFVEEEVEEDDDDDGQGHGKHLVITWTGPENADVQAGTEQIPWMGSQEEKKKTTTAQPHQAAKFQLRLPFRPGVQGLKTLHVDMHGATTTAFDMGDEVAAWFTRHLGFETRMAYLGPAHSRPVLGSGAPSSDLAVQKRMPRVLYRLRQLLVPPAWRAAAERISFTDIAQFLVVTTESNAEVTRRLREDEDTTAAAATGDGDNDNKNVQMDVTKFRPNIVLSGSPAAFDEDYWAELLFRRTGVRMAVTLNCWRCQSIVVDYRTGRPAAGASGLAWKKLSRDRRVDKGWKYNPVFGRYGFCAAKETDKEIRVGDEVLVAKRAPEISVFGRSSWSFSSFSFSCLGFASIPSLRSRLICPVVSPPPPHFVGVRYVLTASRHRLAHVQRIIERLQVVKSGFFIIILSCHKRLAGAFLSQEVHSGSYDGSHRPSGIRSGVIGNCPDGT